VERGRTDREGSLCGIRRSLSAGLTCLALSACSSVGPHTVPPDRFDYVTAISDSTEQTLLLNIVKLRYGKPPVFVEVSSIITQYLIDTSLGLTLGWNAPVLPGSSQIVGGNARYAERPTITYTPITGDKFTRQLLTPIPPQALMSFTQAGWPVNLTYRVAVNSINEVRNYSTAPAWARPADPDFDRLIDAMARIQKSGALSLRREQRGEKTVYSAVFSSRRADPEVRDDIATVRRILGLKPDTSEVEVVFGSVPSNDREIAMQTRSVLEIMIEAASQMEVPEEDVAAHRVTTANLFGAKPEDVAIMRIHSGRSRPNDAFVAAEYRGYWFWVDGGDGPSKLTFSFIEVLLSLTETGVQPAPPIVTIPAG